MLAGCSGAAQAGAPGSTPSALSAPAVSTAPAISTSPNVTAAPAATASSADRRRRAQRLLDGFVAAARRGDHAAAAALVSTRDQSFVGRAAIWAANLRHIAWQRLTWTVESPAATLPDRRRAVLGAGAWAQRVRVTWALPGERRVAQSEIWLTFVDQPAAGGGLETRLAGDTDSPAALGPMPVWLQQPIRLLRRGPVLVLTGTDDASAWLTLASAAHRAVRDRVGEAGRDPHGVLVVAVPASRAIFERAIGVPAGTYSAIAAAAWPMGRDTATAPIHVVVNPGASGRLSTLGRNVLLTHEAVHVATRSPGSPMPTWLVEGYADQVAYDAFPAGSKPARQSVAESVREDGAPRDWPDSDDFAPDAADLGLGYDLAWTAAHSIARAHGDGGLDRFYAAADHGASIGLAARALGTSEKALLRQWRADLERTAGR